MKSQSLLRSIVLLAVVAMAVPVFAKPISKTINIPSAAKVGKADLQAGEYHGREGQAGRGGKRRALGRPRRKVGL
jgi:hypothetical protein